MSSFRVASASLTPESTATLLTFKKRLIARKGKSSMVWFFGFKLHLISNQYGQIVRFQLTTGNIADNNHDLLRHFLQDMP